MVVHFDASRAVSDQPTGVNVYARELMEHLPLLYPEAKFIFYAPTWCRDTANKIFVQLPDNCTWRFLRWPPRILWTQKRLCLAWWWAARRGTAADVFFVPAHLAPWWSPRNLVVTIHDVAHRHVPEAYTWWQRTLADILVRRNVQQARAVLAISQDTKNDLQKFFAVPPEKIFVTPLARPCARTRGSGVVPPRLVGKNFILFVGRLEWKKGVDRLLRVFFALHKRNFATELVLVGKPGVGYEKIRRLIIAYPGQELIHEMGFVADTTLNALYRAAAAFVLPSRYEGFGINPVEAMAARVPVVAWRAGAIPEVVGEAAALVSNEGELQNALEKILTDENYARQLRSAGEERAAQFSWEITARLTGEILRKN